MPLFRVRPMEVEAERFTGTSASALEVIEWARSVAPQVVVRERIEYGGWDDESGHIELEIQDLDTQAMQGDWVVCIELVGRRHLEVMTGSAFTQRFERVQETRFRDVSVPALRALRDGDVGTS